LPAPAHPGEGLPLPVRILISFFGALENIFVFKVCAGLVCRYAAKLHQLPARLAILVQYGRANPFFGGSGSVFPRLGCGTSDDDERSGDGKYQHFGWRFHNFSDVA